MNTIQEEIKDTVEEVIDTKSITENTFEEIKNIKDEAVDTLKEVNGVIEI